MPELMPAIFFGHGNPMNAVMTNGYTEAWRRIGGNAQAQSHPLDLRSLVCAGNRRHDQHLTEDNSRFRRLSPRLFRVQYPAPGDPQLARRVQQLLAPLPVTLDNNWGLDHGTWSVLVHAYPKADIPVVQLSINESQPASFHFEIGKKLAPLRDEGILIVGSGNLVHNLHTYAWGRHMPEPYDWAIKFELEARQMMLDGDFEPLVAYEKLGQAAMLSIPTPDHYLPLLYVVATQQPGENITFPVEGVDGGSISMLSVRVGPGEGT